MLKTKRITAILDYVQRKHSVSLDDLVKEFNVSKNTIRRDVQELVDQKKLQKVYGGVSIPRPLTVPYQDRKIQNFKEKEIIAELAADYIKDGDIIFLDSGTTTGAILEFIKNKSLTIVTNNMDFTLDATPYPQLQIYGTGGVFERSTRSYVGMDSAETIAKYNFNKAIMATTGLSIDKGFTNSSPLETQIKRNAMEKSETIFVLADHSKFDRYSITTYGYFDEIDYIITDREPPKHYIDAASEYKNHIIYPK
ncbi:DeoR/GlpR family DNA-binding transcription regulator [Gracilibacillus suaedae]|uniref:DeoR/GlpR family DNA-binding transcription regulator n=1 Tax=Gracilibacillus suaedae TaxID=2820273 RepID=UPI001ABE0F7F|nr:DeoR/GlpR family DNA-binding transcription regulator [Gracilibacillus suaedae]